MTSHNSRFILFEENGFPSVPWKYSENFSWKRQSFQENSRLSSLCSLKKLPKMSFKFFSVSCCTHLDEVSQYQLCTSILQISTASRCQPLQPYNTLPLVPAGCHLGLVLLLRCALLSALSLTYLFSIPQEFWIILVWDWTVFSTIFCKPAVLPERGKCINTASTEAVLKTEPGLLPYNSVTAVS